MEAKKIEKGRSYKLTQGQGKLCPLTPDNA